MYVCVRMFVCQCIYVYVSACVECVSMCVKRNYVSRIVYSSVYVYFHQCSIVVVNFALYFSIIVYVLCFQLSNVFFLTS